MRFVIMNHFKEDFVSKVLINLSEDQGDGFFFCMLFTSTRRITFAFANETFKCNGVYLTLTISQPHKHYLVWYKQKCNQRQKTCILDLIFYKRMTGFQEQWIEWLFKCPVCVPWWGLLFNLKKNIVRRSSWMSFKRLKTNALDWVEEKKIFMLFGAA